MSIKKSDSSRSSSIYVHYKGKRTKKKKKRDVKMFEKWIENGGKLIVEASTISASLPFLNTSKKARRGRKMSCSTSRLRLLAG